MSLLAYTWCPIVHDYAHLQLQTLAHILIFYIVVPLIGSSQQGKFWKLTADPEEQWEGMIDQPMPFAPASSMLAACRTKDGFVVCIKEDDKYSFHTYSIR